MESDGILSPEDEALFDTSINRFRKKLNRPALLFIAIVALISMLAGFFGGMPLVLLSNSCRVSDVEPTTL